MKILESQMTTQNLDDHFIPDFGQMNENELLEQCCREIPHRLNAYRELVTRYESEVFETCFRLVADKSAAEQICEDAFVQVFHQIHQFQAGVSHSSVRVWLFQIAFRLCELHVEGNPYCRGTAPASGSDPMGAALSLLEWEERSWIVLRFVGCLQTGEIGEIFEIGIRDAKERIYNALCRFRKASELIAS